MVQDLKARITFRITEQEKKDIEAAAACTEKTTAQYIRDIIKEHIQKENQ